MSKAEALALTHRLKRGAVWAALGAFALLAGLAGAHVVGVTSAASSSSTGVSGGTDDQQPSIQQNNPFFGSQSGGGSFGSNGGGNSQSPVTGSGVS